MQSGLLELESPGKVEQPVGAKEQRITKGIRESPTVTV